MVMRRSVQPRSGATLVESALVYSILFLVLLGTMILVLGVFRYMEIAALAREGCRWASVHGQQYAKETGKPVATGQAVKQAIASQAVGLDLTKLNVTLNPDPVSSPYYAGTSEGDIVPYSNTVTVTITYQWIPEASFGLFVPITLTSTAESVITY
jgi:hypothetical protein